MAMKTMSFPAYCVMMGSVVSIVVAPPAQMGESRPKYFTNRGAPTNAVISRIMLAIRAIVPSSVAACSPMSAVLSWVMRIDDKE